MDLTYFADYQCRVIIRAIAEFKKAYRKTQENMEAFNVFLLSSGLYRMGDAGGDALKA